MTALLAMVDPARCTLRYLPLRLGPALEPACDEPVTPEEEQERIDDASTVSRVLAILSEWRHEEIGWGSQRRLVTMCPSCQDLEIEPSGFRLVTTYPDAWRGEEFFARCLNGCEPDAIARALEREIAEYDDGVRAYREQRALEEMSLDQIDTLASTGWLIPGLVAAASFNTMLGAEFGGKSWLATAIGVCVAAGIRFPGIACDVEALRVMLVYLELGQEDRIDRIAAGLGTTRENLRDQLLLCDVRRKPARAPLERWIAQQARAARARLVVIDNQSEFFKDASENAPNSDSYVRNLLRPIRDLRNDGIATILLNHTNSAGKSKGSQAAPAMSDHELTLKRSSPKPDAIVRVAIRSRRAGALAAFSYRMVDDPDRPVSIRLADGTSRELAAVVPQVAEDRPKAKAAPVAVDGVAARRAAMLALPELAEGVNAERLHKLMSCGRTHTLEVRNQLAAEGLIHKGDDGLWRRVGGPA